MQHITRHLFYSLTSFARTCDNILKWTLTLYDFISLTWFSLKYVTYDCVKHKNVILSGKKSRNNCTGNWRRWYITINCVNVVLKYRELTVKIIDLRVSRSLISKSWVIFFSTFELIILILNLTLPQPNFRAIV